MMFCHIEVKLTAVIELRSQNLICKDAFQFDRLNLKGHKPIVFPHDLPLVFACECIEDRLDLQLCKRFADSEGSRLNLDMPETLERIDLIHPPEPRAHSHIQL